MKIVVLEKRCPMVDLQAFLLLQLPYYISMLFAPARSGNLLRKQINTKLMYCEPLFIIHGRVKGLLKFYWSAKQSVSAQEVGVAHA